MPSEEESKKFVERLNRFETWFKAQGNESLVRFERAILITFMYWEDNGETGNNSDQL